MLSSNLNSLSNKQVTAGNGLTGGGTINSNPSLILGTPSTITNTSVNSVTSTSHTHAITNGSLTESGIVQLTNVIEDLESKAVTSSVLFRNFEESDTELRIKKGAASDSYVAAGGVLILSNLDQMIRTEVNNATMGIDQTIDDMQRQIDSLVTRLDELENYLNIP